MKIYFKTVWCVPLPKIKQPPPSFMENLMLAGVQLYRTQNITSYFPCFMMVNVINKHFTKLKLNENVVVVVFVIIVVVRMRQVKCRIYTFL